MAASASASVMLASLAHVSRSRPSLSNSRLNNVFRPVLLKFNSNLRRG
jgi:hypothetical protein